MVAGYVELFDPTVFVGVPFQLVVPPKLLHPKVGRHYLVLEVLKTAGISFIGNLNISLSTSIMTQGYIIILCYFVVNCN